MMTCYDGNVTAYLVLPFNLRGRFLSVSMTIAIMACKQHIQASSAVSSMIPGHPGD